MPTYDRDDPMQAVPDAEGDDDSFWDIWEQWEGETDLWYGRFRRYLMQGRGRSYAQAVVLEWWETHPEGPALNRQQIKHLLIQKGYYNHAIAWRWKERALAYDKYQDKLEEQSLHAERMRARDARRTLLSKFNDEVFQAIPELSNARVSWNGIANAIKVLTDSSRTEFDDMPVTRTESTVTVTEIKEFTLTVINAFNEVNTIDDPEQRRELFAARLEAFSNADHQSVA